MTVRGQTYTQRLQFRILQIYGYEGYEALKERHRSEEQNPGPTLAVCELDQQT